MASGLYASTKAIPDGSDPAFRLEANVSSRKFGRLRFAPRISIFSHALSISICGRDLVAQKPFYIAKNVIFLKVCADDGKRSFLGPPSRLESVSVINHFFCWKSFCNIADANINKRICSIIKHGFTFVVERLPNARLLTITYKGLKRFQRWNSRCFHRSIWISKIWWSSQFPSNFSNFSDDFELN